MFQQNLLYVRSIRYFESKLTFDSLPSVLLTRGALHAQQQSKVENTCKKKLICHTFPFWIHVQIHLQNEHGIKLTFQCTHERLLSFVGWNQTSTLHQRGYMYLNWYFEGYYRVVLDSTWLLVGRCLFCLQYLPCLVSLWRVLGGSLGGLSKEHSASLVHRDLNSFWHAKSC